MKISMKLGLIVFLIIQNAIIKAAGFPHENQKLVKSFRVLLNRSDRFRNKSLGFQLDFYYLLNQNKVFIE